MLSIRISLSPLGPLSCQSVYLSNLHKCPVFALHVHFLLKGITFPKKHFLFKLISLQARTTKSHIPSHHFENYLKHTKAIYGLLRSYFFLSSSVLLEGDPGFKRIPLGCFFADDSTGSSGSYPAALIQQHISQTIR